MLTPVMKKALAKYVWNFWISIDQLANVLTGGDPDETISSRLGRIKLHNGGSIPWKRPVAKVTDFLLEVIDPGHSLDAIEPGHGDEGVTDTPTKLPSKWWEHIDKDLLTPPDLPPDHKSESTPDAAGDSRPWPKIKRRKPRKTR